MEKEDYLKILMGLREIPFDVGKNLLADFLIGSYDNDSIAKNDLDSLNSFGILQGESRVEVLNLIEEMIRNGFIEAKAGLFNKYAKVLRMSLKGNKELINPSLFNSKKDNFEYTMSEISDKDLEAFKILDGFLNGYNDLQKKAIISESKKILCVAGAGSGKTTVLTKRIEFLIKYKGINPEKILAITFTRKAKKEMEERLGNLGISANVETFNSFSEKILRKYGGVIYGRKMNVIGYRDKIISMSMALENIGLKIEEAIDIYFSEAQKKNKTKEQLSGIFMNDCFSVLEYFKVQKTNIYDFSVDAEENKKTAKMVYDLCKFLKEYLDVQGLRSFTDQVLDTIDFFNKSPNHIPEFEHILVDEYQDVNAMQIELLELLKPKNIFVVGDPRQSIFGWRGSDIKYIKDFEKKYSSCEIINLDMNYRSAENIVNFMNWSLKEMNLPDLKNWSNIDGDIKIFNFSNESEEYAFVVNAILNSEISRKEIFVLARTNRQINEISLLMKQKGINFLIKSEDDSNGEIVSEDQVTLATVHSIKGLEAKMVFVIGVNENNFPCKASDHPVIELIKFENYDKISEEKRLFYVAISRAKEKLILTYTGKKPSYFVTKEMMEIVDEKV